MERAMSCPIISSHNYFSENPRILTNVVQGEKLVG